MPVSPKAALALLALALCVAGCGSRLQAPAASGALPYADPDAGLHGLSNRLKDLAALAKAPDPQARRRLIAARVAARHRELRALQRSQTVRAALRHAYLTGNLDGEAYHADRATLTKATSLAAGLRGVRGAEQRAALRIVQRLAAAHQLTAGRIPVAFIQLHRNSTWWAHRDPPAYGQSLIEGHDPVTMRYVPGQGLVVHHLASWGRVNALARNCSNKPQDCPKDRLRASLQRMLSIATRRNGFLTWESLFHWDGGRPGWVSAITQGTAIQALARGGNVLNSSRFTHAAHQALGAFEQPPPVGLSVPAVGGRHYLMYSFAPGLRILNGFLRALTGLRDLAILDNSARARHLYRAGAEAARHEIGADDTGAWSLYSDGGAEASFGYHRLATGFLNDLCALTRRRDFCADAGRFAAYMVQPPRIEVSAQHRPVAGHRMRIAVGVSKISTLNVVVTGVFGPAYAKRLSMPRGTRVLILKAPPVGRYTITVDAQGPSGPLGHAEAHFRTNPAHPRHRGHHG